MTIPNTRPALELKLRKVVANKLRIDPTRIRMEDDVIVDLGADSLAMAELTVELEQLMGVKVSGDEWLEVSTLCEMLDLMERHKRE